ncbi:uncharacterized protein MYCFIDRAFT_214574 [Pseudocercospora fijiensis CIRAD86]|uniref:Uncharacterized protein n=1 Tax=Pseudocercospora fijiensis (strain CIRAD86) TaxID=383855 RepID=M3AHD3_PSEFD|nr:uncharacterized protein MYCFIDRAFT_214574 [Pseudocercospora fijiensis CIRAD86]EME83991.1 hypothetical protein MYCFIDRAFT_214574 [Pseudocercospora fijiensis CIRAD86]
MSYGTLNCTNGGGIGTNIIANQTGSRYCGLFSDRTVIEQCCDGSEILSSSCEVYCAYTGTIRNWIQCVSGNSSDSTPRPDAFCLSGTSSNLTESVKTSFGFRTKSAPKIGWVVLGLLFSSFLIGPCYAANGDCSLHVDHTFPRLGSSKIVSNHFECVSSDEGFCDYSLPISTPRMSNNRSLTTETAFYSAAAPEFDGIFEKISNATNGRQFPALSQLNITYEFAVGDGQSFSVGWTPYLFCVNGTLTNCGDVLPDEPGLGDDMMGFEACGPLFVDDENSYTNPNATINGVLNPIYTG